MEEGEDAQLSIYFPQEAPAVVLSIRLGDLSNDVVVAEHHALGQTGCSLNGIVNRQWVGIPMIWVHSLSYTRDTPGHSWGQFWPSEAGSELPWQ